MKRTTSNYFRGFDPSTESSRQKVYIFMQNHPLDTLLHCTVFYSYLNVKK